MSVKSVCFFRVCVLFFFFVFVFTLLSRTLLMRMYRCLGFALPTHVSGLNPVAQIPTA